MFCRISFHSWVQISFACNSVCMTRRRCQNVILYLGVTRCCILNFLFQIRGVISFSCYIPLFVVFFGEIFIVKWSYNNITIFHLKILNQGPIWLNLICSCNYTIYYDTPTSLSHCTGWQFWANIVNNRGPRALRASPGAIFTWGINCLALWRSWPYKSI